MALFSIVVPVYQNEKNLENTIPKLLDLEKVLPGIQIELIFVDDGSKDLSHKIISNFQNRYPDKISSLKLTRNFGQNPAIQAGLRYAKGDCVGIISADLQEPHEIFQTMVKAWKDGAKFVLGERTDREDGLNRAVTGQFYWWILRTFAWKDFPQKGYDFCLLDRQVVDQVNNINELNTAMFQLIYWLGYTPVRIPIVRGKREAGKSQWSFFKKSKFTIDTLIGFTRLPARLITIGAFGTSIATALYLIYLLIHYFIFGAKVDGWMSTVGLVLFFGSVTIFSLGIICEYIWRILEQVRGRPPFVVENYKPTTNHK